jgi:hypothetical protein
VPGRWKTGWPSVAEEEEAAGLDPRVAGPRHRLDPRVAGPRQVRARRLRRKNLLLRRKLAAGHDRLPAAGLDHQLAAAPGQALAAGHDHLPEVALADRKTSAPARPATLASLAVALQALEELAAASANQPAREKVISANPVVAAEF